jgi:hypothetical protein
MIYDAETHQLVPLLSTGGLFADEVLHPFIIVRVLDLVDGECTRLRGCIRKLMRDREAAQNRRDAEIGFAHAEAEMPILTEIGAVGGSGALGDAGSVVGPVGDLLDLGRESGLDVRVMIVFDEDPKDLDYVDEASDGNSSGGEESSEGEGEAVETDHEAEEKAVVGLACLASDDSFCSQEI